LLDWPAVFLCCNVLSSFGSKVMLALQSELGSVPSFSFPWKNLYKIDVISSLNVWKNLSAKPFGHVVFFVGRF